MQGSMKTVVLGIAVLVAALAALTFAGKAVAAPAYCSNAAYWAAEDDANSYQESAHDLFMAGEYLDAYGEMLSAKYEIAGTRLPCQAIVREHRRLSLLKYSTWATAMKQSYLENFTAADRAFQKTEGYLKQLRKLLKRMPKSAFA